MRAIRILVVLLVAVIVGTIAVVAAGWQPSIEPVPPPQAASLDPEQVRQGRVLAAIGDCNACHTAPEGRPYAGGLPIETPFGTVYSTNITPDPDTGIGRWSLAAFQRALWRGVDREGRHLYPAFPYDHFRRVAAADVEALYAYLMARDPVRAETPPNRLAFPFNLRPLLAGWKLLFLDDPGFQGDAAKPPEWNRGAYLAEGLAHCGACHTPRNFLGAVQQGRAYAGGTAEGWHAPALDETSPAPVPWTAQSLERYLRNVVAPRHDVPAGPMVRVSHNLSEVPAAEVRAIVTYFMSLLGEPTDARRQRAEQALARGGVAAGAPDADAPAAQVIPGYPAAPPGSLAQSPGPARSVGAVGSAGAVDDARLAGRAIYLGACAGCHDVGRGLASGNAIHLALSTAVTLPTPANLVRVIVEGVVPAEGEAGRWMPAFGQALTDAQVVALAGFVREEFGGLPRWDDIAGEVVKARRHLHAAADGVAAPQATR